MKLWKLIILVKPSSPFVPCSGTRKYNQAIIYCNATHDGYLCWPPTIAGQTAFQNCPAAKLSDPSRLAFRRCDMEGMWLGRRANESSPKGWTNYTLCFPSEVQKLLIKVKNDENLQDKLNIAQNTRYLEIAGFGTSFIALLVSLYIFTHFRSLRNTRTNIHRNLFMAMTIQVFLRLIMYIDQAIVRNQSDPKFQGLDGMPYLCEVSYILLEYAVTSMFMWMFLEGLYLYSVVTFNVLRERSSSTLFLLTGWGLPVFVTTLWAVVTGIYYKNDTVKGCWYGYNFLAEYWFLQAPRLAVILINFCFLLQIMRVLITKLNATENNDITKIKKATRAALFLLPLLGITNILNMIEPVTGAVWKFACWCYITHFLRSFQGFFIALIYCFLNVEVNDVVRKSYRDRIEERRVAERRERYAAAQQQLRSTWCYSCMEALMTPLRKASRWLQSQRNPNSVQNVEVAMQTLNQDEHPNYADPYVQSCMPEVRLENNRLVIVENY